MKHIILYMMLAGAVMFGSCNDWLDVSPRSEVPEDELFGSEQGFRDALVSCYIKMNGADLYGLELTIKNMEYLAQHWSPSVTGASVDVIAWKNFDYANTYVESGIAATYEALYNVIAQANTILENLPLKGGVITDRRMRSIIEAEALSVRAYCHMDILRMFGEVPGGTVRVSLPYAETVSTAAIPYYDFDGFVDRILADITRAQSLLEGNEPLMDASYNDPTRNYHFGEVYDGEDFYSYRRFRFNSYALRGMKARLYLWTGTAANRTKAWDEATGLIAALQDPRQTMLLAGIADLGASYFSLPSECIMALSNFNMRSINNAYLTQGILFQESSSITADIFAGQSMSINNRGIYLWDMSAVTMSRSTPFIKKFTQPATTATETSTLSRAIYNEVMPLLRLSEIYLIAMETAPAAVQANALYKTYMDARGVSVSDSHFATLAEVKAAVLAEYRREFFAEGQMFYTYKRMNVRNMLWKTDREVTEQDYTVPLPLSEVNAN